MKKTLSAVLSLILTASAGLAQLPSSVPCRISDGENREVMIMVLGDVKPVIADGSFDPANDRVTLKTGRVIENYYRDSLKVAFYRPMEKKEFPLPPTGWCSWYYYYKEVTENDVLRNARWVAENLKDYGIEYVQVDDGWQGKDHEPEGARDWTSVSIRFPSGLDKLAGSLKYLGFKPGIWLAPHGQSSETAVKKNPGVFLLKPDGSTVSDTWEGKYLIDPSSKESGAYLKELFGKLVSWGYEYFKIDGQPVVVREYRSKKGFMHDSTQNPNLLYRATLDTIRSAVGSGRYILGCWGIPLEGAGIMNGSRTGGDIVPAWSGFEISLAATMQYYFLHNIVWYNDPDCLLLRPPLTVDQARSWATLQGLTGQALMVSERMSDLPEERLEILRRVIPAADVRPMDLFPSERYKKIWDLKVSHLNRNYDVVGLFNTDRQRGRQIYLKWKDLGITESGPVQVYDFWNREYLGSWNVGMAVDVPPAGCRVLTLMIQSDHVQLISTSSHITQGWTDLKDLSYEKNTWKGKSRVVMNDRYELRFVFPRTMNYVVAKAAAEGLKVKADSHQGWATVEFTSPETKEVEWEVSFARSEYYAYPLQEPGELRLSDAGPDGLHLEWSDQYYLSAGYQVYLNGNVLGYSPTNRFAVRGLDPRSSYRADVSTVWINGIESAKRASMEFTPVAYYPEAIQLSEITPLSATSGWGVVQMDRSISGNPLSIGERKFQTGIGTHANSEIKYALDGLYRSFSAFIGIDDGNNSQGGSVEFTVLGDDRVIWRSGLVRKTDAAREIMIDITGVKVLSLRVTNGGDGIDFDHADWARAAVSGLQK